MTEQLASLFDENGNAPDPTAMAVPPLRSGVSGASSGAPKYSGSSKVDLGRAVRRTSLQEVAKKR